MRLRPACRRQVEGEGLRACLPQAGYEPACRQTGFGFSHRLCPFLPVIAIPTYCVGRSNLAACTEFIEVSDLTVGNLFHRFIVSSLLIFIGGFFCVRWFQEQPFSVSSRASDTENESLRHRKREPQTPETRASGTVRCLRLSKAQLKDTSN